MIRRSREKIPYDKEFESMDHNFLPGDKPSYGRQTLERMAKSGYKTSDRYSPKHKTGKKAVFKSPNSSSPLDDMELFELSNPNSHLDVITSQTKLETHSSGQECTNSRSPLHDGRKPVYEFSSPLLYPVNSLNEMRTHVNGDENIELDENDEALNSSSYEEQKEEYVIPSSKTPPTVKHRAQHIPKTEKRPDIPAFAPTKKSKPVKKTTRTEPNSGYTVLYTAIGILITVIASVLLAIYYYSNELGSSQTTNFLPKTSQSSMPQIDVATIMENLERDFKEQPSMTFKIVKSAILTLNKMNPKEPAIIALLAEQGAEDVSRSFSRQLAESVSLYTDVVTISGNAFSEQDPDTAKKAIDDLLKKGLKENKLGAVFVDRLDYIPGNAALIFHTYCDHENAPFKRVVYVMTVASQEKQLALAEPKEWDTKFQEHLYTSWSVVGVDQISSLMSRLTVRVAAIVPKHED